ncbi:MAG: tetratricopeptide repeat protein, partial [Spirochaetia bacterium]
MKKRGETSFASGRRRPIILLFAVLIMLASAAAPALAEGQPERPPGPDYDPALDEMTPAELLDRSRITPSGSERASIRGYLARVHPERAEGIAAQAWIVSRDDNFERSAELYRRALELDPTISVVRNNLAYVLGRLGRYEEQVAVRERQLALDPEYGQYQPFVWNYFNYRQRLGGEPAAERYRARLEDQLGESHFVLTQIDAIEAIDAGDHERALELRRRRIAEGDPPYWFREDYALHEYRQRNQNAQNVGERLTPLAELSTWAQHHSSEENSHRALMLSAERLAEDFEAYSDALSLYLDAFDAYPAAEAIDDAFGFSRSRYREESLSFLEDALNTLPYSPLVRRIEAWNYINFDFDPERAERAARRALELSATPQERRLSVERLANVYEYTMLDYDRAHEVLTDNAESYADDRARHLVELYENRLEAQDFAQAAAYLERRGELGDLDRSWYQESRLRVGRLLDSTQERTPDAEIVLSGSFEGNPMAISPDGSLAAVGFYPMQLWDIESGQKVRDLGRGGPTRRFSPDGRYVASISNYNVASGRVESALYVYDVQRGDLLFVLPSLAYDLRDFAWSPDSTRVAFGDRTGQIRVYDVPSGMPAGVFRASDVRIAPRLTWLPNGEIAIAQAQAETIRLFDGDSYEFLRDLPGVRWPHTITHTAGGTYLVVTDDNYRLHVWDTESWTRRSGRIPVFARRIAAHPERPYIAVNDAGNNSVQSAVYDVATMQVVGVRTGRERVRPGFAGDRLAIGDGSSVQFYSLPDLAPAGRLQSFSSNGSGTILETGSGYALTQDEAGTHFFNLERGRHDATVDISATFTDLGNGNLLYFEDGGARVFSTRSFDVAREFDVGVAVDHVAIGNDVLAIGGTPLGDDAGRVQTGVVEVYSRDDFSLEYS